MYSFFLSLIFHIYIVHSVFGKVKLESEVRWHKSIGVDRSSHFWYNCCVKIFSLRDRVKKFVQNITVRMFQCCKSPEEVGPWSWTCLFFVTTKVHTGLNRLVGFWFYRWRTGGSKFRNTRILQQKRFFPSRQISLRWGDVIEVQHFGVSHGRLSQCSFTSWKGLYYNLYEFFVYLRNVFYDVSYLCAGGWFVVWTGTGVHLQVFGGTLPIESLRTNRVSWWTGRTGLWGFLVTYGPKLSSTGYDKL